MALLYFYTSALIKRYKAESGSDVIDILFQKKGDSLFLTSFWTVVEMTAVLSLKVRRKELSERVMHSILGCFHQDLTLSFRIQSITDYHIQKAIGHAQMYPLSPSDCLHLATARAVQRGQQRIIMVAADRQLLMAAQAEGVASLDPEEMGAYRKALTFLGM